MINLRCPVCDRSMERETPQALPHLPFCSERCRTIDLGRWLGGRYSVPAEDPSSFADFDLDDESAPPP